MRYELNVEFVSCEDNYRKSTIGKFGSLQVLGKHSDAELVLQKRLINYYVSSIILHGSETWTLTKDDKNYLDFWRVLKCAGDEWRK